jgi:hypothetical protein
MAYTHNKRSVITFSRDPLDPDSTDWFYFSYQDWLRADETITEHSALIENGTIITDSVFVDAVTDSEGDSYTDCYAVEISPASGATSVTLTHRVTTTTSGVIDLGRTAIDHSMIIPVKHL